MVRYILYKVVLEDIMEDIKQKKGINPKVLIAIVVCLIVVGAVCVFGMYRYMDGKNNKDNKDNQNVTTDVNGSNLVITEDKRVSASDIAEKVNDSMIVVKMTAKWTFNSDCTSSNAYLGNSDKNSYPLRFEVMLKDTGEVLLTTPDVPVGSCIQNFGLPKKLDSGTYDVIISHQAVKDGSVFSTVKTAAQIVVQ